MPQKFRLTYLDHGVGSPLRLSEDDIKLVFERLPEDTWTRFQLIHFNDPRRGLRWIGYINHERAEIAISPLPPGVRRIRFVMRSSKGNQVRRPARRANSGRDMLFDVLVDEIGRLQILDEQMRNGVRLRSYDPKPDAHADYWRLRLWSFKFGSGVNGKSEKPRSQEEFSEVIDVTEEKT